MFGDGGEELVEGLGADDVGIAEVFELLGVVSMMRRFEEVGLAALIVRIERLTMAACISSTGAMLLKSTLV